MLSSRLRTVCFAGLFVGCAALLGVGCSDDNTKKVRGSAGEAGEAGEVAAGGTSAGTGGVGGVGGKPVTPTGGDAGVVSEAGQGGAPVVGAAGAPTTTEAGAGGDAGAAGAGSLACVSGAVHHLSIPAQARKTVCRGLSQVFNFEASTTDATFTCCSSVGPIAGIGNGDTGQFVFTVPADAPFGQQSITPTCSEGAVTGSMDIDVSDSAIPPEVDGFEESSIFQGDPLQIDGNHLDLVSKVTVISAGDPTLKSGCTIDPEQGTSLTLVCNIDGQLPPGDYSVVVEEPDCGSLLVVQTLTIKPNT